MSPTCCGRGTEQWRCERCRGCEPHAPCVHSSCPACAALSARGVLLGKQSPAQLGTSLCCVEVQSTASCLQLVIILHLGFACL